MDLPDERVFQKSRIPFLLILHEDVVQYGIAWIENTKISQSVSETGVTKT